MRSLIVVALVAACGGSPRAVTDPTELTPAFDPAQHLRGDWAYEDGSGVEHWTSLSGVLWGIAFVGDQFEVMAIDDDGDRLRFHAMPGGAAETVFVAAETAPGSITFRNPQHDFPTAITYRRDDDDALIATLEGPDGPVPPIVMAEAPLVTEAEQAAARAAYEADRARGREPVWSFAAPDGALAATVGRRGGGSYATIWSGEQPVFDAERL